MNSTRRLHLPPLLLLGVGLAGLAWLVRDLVVERRGEGATDSARGDLEGDPGFDPDRAASAIARRREREPDIVPLPGPTRDALPIGSLALPDREALRKLELQGRAVFFGLVLGPDGTPCPGATLFHCGDPVATSDALGAWKIEVAHDVGDTGYPKIYSSALRRSMLSARKDGVGTACALLRGPSRRIDLTLRGGHRLSGRCLDRWTKEPVPGASIDLILEPVIEQQPTIGLSISTTADELGRFHFADLPSATFELRGRGRGHDSNGFEPLDFTGDRDRDYLLLLDPTIAATGWFSPWPPPGGPVDDSRIVVRTTSPQDHGFDRREFGGPVREDGSFRVELPQCPRFDVSLCAGEGLLWHSRIELDVAPHDVDFGRIELQETGRIRGRVLVPPMLAGAELHLLVDGADSRDELITTLDAEGRFAFGPARTGEASFFVVLPGGDAVGLESRARAAARFAADRAEPGDAIEPIEPLRVVANETRVVDDLAPDGSVDWICVRLLDEGGTPIHGAVVRAGWADAPAYGWRAPARESGGVYVAQLYQRWDPSEGGTKTLSASIFVSADGFAERAFELDLPAESGFVGCECRLDYGERTRGVLLDEQGTRLVGWRIRFLARPDDEGSRARDRSRVQVSFGDVLASVVTDASGEFDCYGFEASRRHVTLEGPGGESSELEAPAVVDGAMTLVHRTATRPAKRALAPAGR